MSLKTQVSSMFTQQVINHVGDAGDFRALILDRLALRMISSCMRMTNIMDDGISVVEDVLKLRKPLPGFHGIYVVVPTEEVIDAIVNDFAKPPALYEAAHIFFLQPCSDVLLRKLANPAVSSYIHTLKELDLTFIPYESQVFSLDMPNGLATSYAGTPNMQDIVSRLVSVCLCAGEVPTVRYSRDAHSSTEQLALKLQSALDMTDLAKQKRDASNRSQFIVLDRTVDLQSPLMHELTYQAAAYDLLNIQNDVYSYTTTDAMNRESTREVVLGEHDDVWVELRHMHIAEVFEEISSRFNSFVAEANKNQGIKGAKGAEGAEALRKLMKNLPQHREQAQKYSLHLDLSHNINAAFTQTLNACTKAEQNIANQQEPDGTKVRDFVGEISNIIIDRSVSVDDKLRCILLCIIAKNGLPKRELDHLLDNAGIPPARRAAIFNLEKLGIPVVADKSRKADKKAKRKERETKFVLSRWVPIVKDLMEDAIDGDLSLSDFPAVHDGKNLVISQSERKAAPAEDDEVVSSRKRGGWAKKKGQGRHLPTAPAQSSRSSGEKLKLFIFIQGTVCFSEMRSAYEVAASRGWDVYIGSHNISTPSGFIDSLESLDKAAESIERKVVVEGHGEGAITITTGTSKPQVAEDIV